MEIEDSFQSIQLNRALATLSFAVEKTRLEPRLKFGDILANAHDNTLERKHRASNVPMCRRVSMNELQAEQYLEFSLDDDDEEEEEEVDGSPHPLGSSHVAAARRFSSDCRSFKDLQRSTASRSTSTLAQLTSSPDPVMAALKNKRRLMQGVKVPADLQVAIPAAPSLLHSPSLHSPNSQALLPTRPLSVSPSPAFASSDTLLERLQSIKPRASRRFSSIDLSRPGRLLCDPDASELLSPASVTSSLVLGAADRSSVYSYSSSIEGSSPSPLPLSRRVSVRSETDCLSAALAPTGLDQPLGKLAAAGGALNPTSNSNANMTRGSNNNHKAVVRRNTLACMAPRYAAQPLALSSAVGGAESPLGRGGGSDAAVAAASSPPGSCARGLQSCQSLGLGSATAVPGASGGAAIARLRRQSVTFCPLLRGAGGGDGATAAATAVGGSSAWGGAGDPAVDPERLPLLLPRTRLPGATP